MCFHLVWSYVKDMFEHDEDAFLRFEACMTNVHIHEIDADPGGIT